MSNEQKEIKILCVDDEKNILASLKRVFRKDGYKIFLAESGAEGLQVLREQNIDLIISDMRMPHMDGAEFLNVANDIRKNVPSILLTGYSDQESTVRAINDGQISGYISKPWDEFDLKLKIKSLLKISHLEKEKERLLLLTHSQNKKLRDWNKELEVKVADRVSELKQTEGMLDEAYKELSSSYESVIKLLSHAMSTKEYMLTKDYPELPILVQQLATKAGFSEYIVRQTYFSAMLFELGKLAMPEQLLATPQSQLTPEELDKLLAYTTIGASVLADIPNFNETAQIIEKHCEYIDGSGAPNQLALEEIPVGSKVLAIVKDYFLLQSGRFDGKRYCNKKAVDYLLAEAGNKYDEKLVNIFADIVSEVEQSDSQNKERKLSTKALRSGMVLSRDCSNGQGLLLLNKGKLLTNESIKKLIAFEKVYDVPLTYHVFS